MNVLRQTNEEEQHLLVIKVLYHSLKLHVSMLSVSQVFFHAKQKRFPGDSEIFDMIVQKLEFTLLLLLCINQALISCHFIDGQVRDLPVLHFDLGILL